MLAPSTLTCRYGARSQRAEDGVCGLSKQWRMNLSAEAP
jgi:hypothetical protein